MMLTYNVRIARAFRPMTPPPFPSHPGIVARQTGHLGREYLARVVIRFATRETYRATAPSGAIIMVDRCIVVLTATKRQEPQQIWPHGVSVALVGGEKQIGQE